MAVQFDVGWNQDPLFRRQLERLDAVVADMRLLQEGAYPDDLGGEAAPLLDHWAVSRRPAACLMGLSTGHPLLPGKGRPVITSDLMLIAGDLTWARTLSRWYRLGRPAGHDSDIGLG